MHKLIRARSIAVLAAYVVVLQTLLLPLTVAVGVFDAGICSASSLAESQQPTGHGGPCPCAAGCGTQCCDPGFAGPPPAAASTAMARSAGYVVAMAVIEAAARPAPRGSHGARAPPAT